MGELIHGQGWQPTKQRWFDLRDRTVHLSASGSSFSSLFISTSETPGRVTLASIERPFSKMIARACAA